MIEKAKKQFWIVILIISSGILSCDKELDLHVDFEGERLAISCLLNPHDSVRVYIETTNNPLQTVQRSHFGDESSSDLDLPLRVTVADVVLLENDVIVSSFKYDTLSDSFASNYVPQIGSKYQLVVEVSGYDAVISKSVIIPEAIPMELYRSEAVILEDSNSTHISVVRSTTLLLEFADPQEERNFYGTRLFFDVHSSLDFSGGLSTFFRRGL